MLVKFKGELEYLGDLNFEVTSLKEILSLIKMNFGEEISNKIINEKYFYFVTNSLNPENTTVLLPEVIFSDLIGFDTLIIIPEISGETGIEAAAAAIVAAVGATGVAATVITYAIYAIAYLAIAIAVNAIMSAISPTPEYQGDAASAKRNLSNLFSGAPIIREQGGPVPLIFGNPYAGGVLISSGVSTI